MRIERLQVYAPDALIAEARSKGLRNISKFLRVKLEEYNKTHDILPDVQG
jgi:hypothetical protein